MLDPGTTAPKAPKVPSRPWALRPSSLHKSETFPESGTVNISVDDWDAHDGAGHDANREIGRDPLRESPTKDLHPLSRSATDFGSTSRPPPEQFVLYKSYARHSGKPEAPFEAHVRGWLYHPQLNRKGKLMIAAVEKLVGSPGKYSSIADAAAAHVAETQKASQLVDVSESETPDLARQPHSSSWLSFARPPVFRSRSSKSVPKATKHRTAPNSPNPNSQSDSQPISPEAPGYNSAANSAANSAWNSQVNSALNSAYNSEENSAENSALNSACNSASNSEFNSPANTAPGSPSNTAPGSPQLEHSGGSLVAEHLDLASNGGGPDATPPKRPGMRRIATFTFDPHSNPKGKVYSALHWARKEQRNIIRERLAAISHKSLVMRDVQIVVESEPDEHGHRKKRTFWAYTDESGRFGQCCYVSFKPSVVRCLSGSARGNIPLLFIESHGVSVISDIDDTVKHSGVTKSKRELLQNVFAKSFDDVSLEGVSEWYNRMAEAGATFHYVSNSPWQLYDVIHGYLEHHHFPEGSIHLKKYAGVFDGLTEPVKGRKRATLERIFKDFPNHKFILVGDSGEADLEAYSEIAIRFPDQVLSIYIRDITLSGHESLNLLDRKTNHRRHNSADLISLDRFSRVCKKDEEDSSQDIHKGPPKLPPRIRKDKALNIDSQLANRAESLVMRPSAHQDYTPHSSTSRNRDAVMEELNALSLADTKEFKVGSYPPASDRSGHFQNVKEPFLPESHIGSPPKSSSIHTESTLDSRVASPEVDSNPQVTVAEASGEERPTLPPRPKLLRRTSSKIMEGVYTMASASSYAAARFLGPQLPPRPGSNTPTKPSSRKPLRYRGSVDVNQFFDGHHDSHKDLRVGSPSSSEFDSEVHQETPAGFVPSSQDIVDYDKVLADKRSDNWRIRVHKQHRAIPKSVRLRMWRHPDDVEAESLRLIKADDESLL